MSQSIGTRYPKGWLPSPRGLVRVPMRNREVKSRLTLVTLNRRKGRCDAVPKWQAVRWGRSDIAPLSSVAQPGDSGSLTVPLNVNHAELGNSDRTRWARISVLGGSRPERGGGGLAERGGWRKRRPHCNGGDRAARERRYPNRKVAYFHLVPTEQCERESESTGTIGREPVALELTSRLMVVAVRLNPRSWELLTGNSLARFVRRSPARERRE